MTKHIEGWSLQTEYRIIVDAERAAEFSQALGELATEFDATVLSDPEEHQDVPFPFRHDLATEIYEASTGKAVWVVTKYNFDSFAAARKVDPSLVSRAYNTVMREVDHRGCITNHGSNPYYARGELVEAGQGEEAASKVIGGLRVDKIADLQIEFAESGHIHNYGTRSQELLRDFVVELFSPEDPEAN